LGNNEVPRLLSREIEAFSLFFIFLDIFNLLKFMHDELGYKYYSFMTRVAARQFIAKLFGLTFPC